MGEGWRQGRQEALARSFRHIIGLSRIRCAWHMYVGRSGNKSTEVRNIVNAIIPLKHLHSQYIMTDYL